MSLIDKYLVQTAIWWSYTGTDFYGNASYAVPVEVPCRWTDKNEQYMSSEGQVLIARSYVLVDRDMKEKDVLYLGTISSAIDADNPKSNKGAFEIKSSAKIPWIDATWFLRKVYL